MTPQQGNVYVLSAPSGAGKSTLVRRLLEKLPDLIFSISFTTRPPREGEVNGEDYFFVDDATFDAMLAEDGLLEWVQVYKNRYGTGRAWIQEQRASGRDILLDIETVGAKNVKSALPEAILIFLLPPTAEELTRRLRGRGTETEEQLTVRLQHARHEMEQFPHYDYLVVNEDLEDAYRQLESIFVAERSRLTRMRPIADHILATF
ncbi:guanylate kinase [Holophaga foetida]|uniref:guanylate kinase n=1 Tax=Holophaga foetida TaxID=35839 RepID=UPI000247181C|nr:guanylate kinase [Holophaga foetida]